MALRRKPSLHLQRSFLLSMCTHGIVLAWVATWSVTGPPRDWTRTIPVQIWDRAPQPAVAHGDASSGGRTAPNGTQPPFVAPKPNPLERRKSPSLSPARQRRPSVTKRPPRQHSLNPGGAAKDPAGGASSQDGFQAGSAEGGPVESAAWSRGEAADTVNLAQQYLASLRARIEQHKRYPRQAQELGISGEVRVFFRIAADGSLQEISIASAAHPLLAMAAREAVERAAPFPSPPPGVQRSFMLSLEFQLQHQESFG